jgi:hypothetical protein
MTPDSRIVKILTIVCFIVGVASVPAETVLKVFPEPTLKEKRTLKAMPPYDGPSALFSNAYTGDFEAFFNDHFGFRKIFIRLNNLIDVRLFDTPSNRAVIMGKNDFLFLAPDWNSGTNKPTVYTGEQPAATVKRIKSFQDRLADLGVSFLITIAPNKGTIYPEYLPGNRDDPTTAIEHRRWMRLFEEEGVNHIDLLPIILKAKKERLLYYKGDHHWNRYCGWLVSQAMVERLAIDLHIVDKPRLVRVGEENDIWEDTGGGSIDELLGVKAVRRNVQPILSIEGSPLPPGIVYGDSFIDWLYLKDASERLYPIALGGNLDKHREAVSKSEIKYIVVQYWEANLHLLNDMDLLVALR